MLRERRGGCAGARGHHVVASADRAKPEHAEDSAIADGAVRQLGEPASVVQRPADATVAKLVGYDNVLPVSIDPSGQVLIAGTLCGLPSTAAPGPATLGAWAAAIRIASSDTGPLRARVERVSPGPGRWDVILTAGETLRAHLPLDEEPPGLGEAVAVRIDPTRATVIPDHPTSTPNFELAPR